MDGGPPFRSWLFVLGFDKVLLHAPAGPERTEPSAVVARNRFSVVSEQP